MTIAQRLSIGSSLENRLVILNVLSMLFSSVWYVIYGYKTLPVVVCLGNRQMPLHTILHACGIKTAKIS
jgi:hypothetical protein